jgi:hypothetical protein
MRFLTWSLPVSLCAAAAISSQNQNACIEPNKRVEWRNLKPEDQRSYIDAVLCLKTRPSEIGLNTSRYDDFPYVHTHLDMTSTYLHLIQLTLFSPELSKLTSRPQSPLRGYVSSLAQTFCSSLRGFSSRLWLYRPHAVSQSQR